MSTSDTASKSPTNSSELPASTMTPTSKFPAEPLDPRTHDWLLKLVHAMRRLATDEVERRRVAKKLF